jgi:hypothetical protein
LFVLCDPGLLLPPLGEDVPSHESFWKTLIAWAADRRVSLAPETHEVVIHYFRKEGWPDYEPPFCPRGLKGIASGALSRLLSRNRIPEGPGQTIPSLNPGYVRHEDGALAIALDVSSDWVEGPAALASQTSHWERAAATIVLDPPPPDAIPLVTQPHAETEAESIAIARRRLAKRRITIVGGIRDPQAIAQLAEALGIEQGRIRWIESEPGCAPQTDRMKGMRAHSDVVCCVLGCPGVVGMGHSGTQTATKYSRDRGVAHCSVKTPSEMPAALVELLKS